MWELASHVQEAAKLCPAALDFSYDQPTTTNVLTALYKKQPHNTTLAHVIERCARRQDHRDTSHRCVTVLRSHNLPIVSSNCLMPVSPSVSVVLDDCHILLSDAC